MHNQRGSFIKGLLIYFVVAFVILFAVVSISRKIMHPIEGSAKSFFVAIKEKRLEDAYSMLSDRLRAQSSKIEFHRFLQNYKLYTHISTQWDNVQERGSSGIIFGAINQADGMRVPVEIRVVLEGTTASRIMGGTVDFGNIPFTDNIKVWKIDKILFLNPEQFMGSNLYQNIDRD